MSTPVSARKRAANRANALKSTGPRTPEGKASSRRNATVHGLAAATAPVVTRAEDRAVWQGLLAATLAYCPAPDALTAALVEQHAAAQYRLWRLCAAETADLDPTREEMADGGDARWPGVALSNDARLALAVRTAATDGRLAAWGRYEQRARRLATFSLDLLAGLARLRASQDAGDDDEGAPAPDANDAPAPGTETPAADEPAPAGAPDTPPPAAPAQRATAARPVEASVPAVHLAPGIALPTPEAATPATAPDLPASHPADALTPDAPATPTLGTTAPAPDAGYSVPKLAAPAPTSDTSVPAAVTPKPGPAAPKLLVASSADMPAASSVVPAVVVSAAPTAPPALDVARPAAEAFARVAARATLASVAHPACGGTTGRVHRRATRPG